MSGIMNKSLKIVSYQESRIKQVIYHHSRMLATVSKKYVFSKHFSGEPKPTDLTLVEEKLPSINDGGLYY